MFLLLLPKQRRANVFIIALIACKAHSSIISSRYFSTQRGIRVPILAYLLFFWSVFFRCRLPENLLTFNDFMIVVTHIFKIIVLSWHRSFIWRIIFLSSFWSSQPSGLHFLRGDHSFKFIIVWHSKIYILLLILRCCFEWGPGSPAWWLILLLRRGGIVVFH
jgi:hypothetical protein